MRDEDTIDLTDTVEYLKHISMEEEYTSPCGKCRKADYCHYDGHCRDYRKWKKKYAERNRKLRGYK